MAQLQPAKGQIIGQDKTNYLSESQDNFDLDAEDFKPEAGNTGQRKQTLGDANMTVGFGNITMEAGAP